MTLIIQTQEHQRVIHEFSQSVDELMLSPAAQRLQFKKCDESGRLLANYYVGTDWLVSGESALKVLPKIAGLDILQTFMDCFATPESASALNSVRRDEKLYEIFFDEPPVPVTESELSAPILLILHYVQLLQGLVRKGLQKGYVTVERPLQSNLKGKVLVGKNIKAQLASHNMASTWCRYTEYTLNCSINRLLKRALLISNSYLLTSGVDLKNISSTLGCCKAAFEQVDEDIQPHEIGLIKFNHFYKEYGQTTDLAKKILKLFGNSLERTTQSKALTPPFYINMALLFEIYVLSLLKKSRGKSIQYQVRGCAGTEVDFIDTQEQLIIDTKYKSSYSKFDNNKSYLIDDARQLSGYARDRKLNIALGVEEHAMPITNVKCLIIYPSASGLTELAEYSSKAEIKEFTNFYKLGVKLPTKTTHHF
ncbi:5-methylcytosine restriction system specificity protein McrC [Cellvibrio sp. OA-2007]|uniref:5-methylcytosine restriction system specificity protein McrC n=1 Tax=Cellvibrio sp. OA-2007 TaxID=529823 RepID=UPI000782BEC0|nr:hypothetical protein [Cellvibrio sp. OA-2007]